MATIDSRLKWNDTGINLIKGRRYRYQAIGRWKDWFIECDANGYSQPLMNFASWMKRVRSGRWFQLIGAVNQDASQHIKLGTEGTFTAQHSGPLWAFANDAWFAYWNNSGSVELHVREDA